MKFTEREIELLTILNNGEDALDIDEICKIHEELDSIAEENRVYNDSEID